MEPDRRQEADVIALPAPTAQDGTTSASLGDFGTFSTLSTISTVAATATTSESLWSDTTVPAILNDNERRSVEVGVRFSATVNGSVTGIRFYKGSLNTGTHVGSLWTATGQKLGDVTFTGETASGWQTATFAAPLAITAGTTYVASYLAPNGHYSLDTDYFGQPYSNGSSLQATAGVYAYSSTGAFPTRTWRNSNYWVDVVFEPSEAPVNRAPVATDDGPFSATVDTVLRIPIATLLANDSDLDGDLLTVGAVTPGSGGTVALDGATGEVVFTPEPGYAGAASFSYTVSDGRGDSDTGTVSVSITSGETPSTYSLFGTAPPPVGADPETTAVELGVKFYSSQQGSITGIRFFKSTANTGTHVGTLWTAAGDVLGSVTFTGETASGWQTATFATPIPIAAGTPYVASYHAPNGGYIAESGGFDTAVTSGPLTAPSSAEAGGNGVYAYGGPGSFPSDSWSAANYYVDVVFQPRDPNAPNTPPIASADSGFSAAAGTPVRIAASSLLINDSDADGDPLTVTAVTSGTGGTAGLDTATNEVVFTPADGFTGTASFDYTISDGRGGTASAPVSVSVVPPQAANAIVLENQKPGTPRSEWDLTNGGSSNIEGFATDMSVDRGTRVDFKINTNSTDYRIDIYRLGYYGGDGARKVGSIDRTLTQAQNQPAPLTDSATGLVDADNWAVSASWDVPADAVSGVYIAKLVREDGTFGENHIPFIVRDDGSTSDIVLQTSDTTWQAYNSWGGNSLYVGEPAGRAYKVSYNRPITNRAYGPGTGPRDFLFDSDYPMLRWLEANGYSVSYISGVDTDRYGSQLLNHKLYVSVGHDEYWSGQQRDNVEAARAAGVNLAFFSGNEVFWKTRWEPDADGTGHRTLVSYKETFASDKIDPSPEWTGTWRDPRFSPPSDGGRPENALTGTIFTVNDGSLDRMEVSAEFGRMRLWRNTDLATLAAGQSRTLTADLLSYEWDEDLDNGFRPAGAFRLSETVDPSTQYLLDYGGSYGSRSATHSLVMYRDQTSGALVFGAGTPRWAWGLDPTHDADGGADPYATDIRIAQATVNLFADMGVQPVSLQSGLTPATASTDSTAPVSVIASPGDGGTLSGTTFLVTGTATDSGGGVVAGVEVSTDGGTTWWRADGRSNWSYQWSPPADGTYTLRTRAVDDSANLESPGAGITVTVGGGTPAPDGYTIFSQNQTPQIIADGDTASVELGVKFRAAEAGVITGIRFFKAVENTGTHVGRLWTATGQELAQVTFTDETSSGWQQALFDTPVAIAADTTYVASYHAPNGRYSTNSGFFVNAVTNGPLTALADGTDGGNGVYAYGGSGSFPTSTWDRANYWVDVVFQPNAAA